MRRRPTRAEVAAAGDRTVPDLVRPGLGILFCGINPSLYSAATGCHFARPGNRFWPTLHAAGLTPRLLAPWEGEALLALGIGITNLVDRPTARAEELAPAEIRAAVGPLRAKVEALAPRVVAVLGIGAYRTAFARSRATLGLQRETIGATHLWVLPNPSGLNAHHRPADFARAFADLKRHVMKIVKDDEGT